MKSPYPFVIGFVTVLIVINAMQYKAVNERIDEVQMALMMEGGSRQGKDKHNSKVHKMLNETMQSNSDSLEILVNNFAALESGEIVFSFEVDDASSGAAWRRRADGTFVSRQGLTGEHKVKRVHEWAESQ